MVATEAVADAIVINASNAAGKVAITGTGGITMATTNSVASISTGTGAINVGTDGAVKTITIGNNTGASAVAINAGTAGAGSIYVGATANATPITIGNITGNTGITLNSGTSGVAINTTGTGSLQVTSAHDAVIDSVTSLELNCCRPNINW